MTVNERFALVRKTLKLSQRELAEKIRVRPVQVSNMETGSRRVDPRIMEYLSSAFNINLQWLETGKGEMFYETTEDEIEMNRRTISHDKRQVYETLLPVNERLTLARKTLKLTQREMAERISVSTGFVGTMETGDRKVNPRIMKLIASTFNINLQWLETGEGEMFYVNTENEIEEIISLYKRLNPFFQKFIMRQLRDLIEFR
jgi:transcriptional regulator with XRE-family HTH domain